MGIFLLKTKIVYSNGIQVTLMFNVPLLLAFLQESSFLTATGFVFLAGLGSVARWILNTKGKSKQILGTLTANISSSFILGLLISYDLSPATMTVLGTGLLGSFSTFSTVAMETTEKFTNENKIRACGYFSITVGLGILAAVIGLEIGSG